MAKLGKDYKGILGAAIGDISGSVIEFRPFLKPKMKETAILFCEGSEFTDDTVMTAAIADCMANDKNRDFASSMRKWGREYPNAGYGGHFIQWLFNRNLGPYNSCGNGSAMRISAVAYFAKTEDEAVGFAREATAITHDHPEGIKGAVTMTRLIYKALHGASKEELHKIAISQYDFESLDYETMKAYQGHGQEICQVTVPQALWCFFHSNSFEDCLRIALTIGWDCDTLADIACALAEAYYKEIPESIVFEAQARLTKDIKLALESVPTEQFARAL